MDVSDLVSMSKRVYQNNIAAYIASLILLSLIIGILIRRSITNPISDLVKGSIRISSGDFTERININSTDEIGQLAKTMNEMGQKLEAMYVGLEEEVETKTNELIVSNDKLSIANEELNAAYTQLEAQTKDVKRA